MNTSTAPEALAVDERLCLALYAASRAMTARYRTLLADLGLTYPQYLVMLVLWQDGDQSVSSLAQRLTLDASTLSPLLKRLEVAGLVSRTRDPDDERTLVVAATRRGTALRERARDVPAQISDACGLTPQRQATLVRQLHRLTAALATD